MFSFLFVCLLAFCLEFFVLFKQKFSLKYFVLNISKFCWLAYANVHVIYTLI